MRKLLASAALSAVLLGIALPVEAAAPYSNVYCLATTVGTPSTFNRSSIMPTWNNADNRITIIGGGGDGFVGASGNGGGGGGSGALNIGTNFTLASGTNGYQVGAHGGTTNTTGATWVCNGNATCATINAASVILSIRGGSTAISNTGAAAGAITSAVGGTPQVGATGGSGGSARGGGGGGGAPGLRIADQTVYAGGAGSNSVTGSGVAGGQGASTFGGASGVAPSGNGGDGSEGPTCTGDVSGAVGAGGGGASGASTTNLNGGNGGAYGAGGGGAFFAGTAGLGKQGIIIFEWNPVPSTSTAIPFLLGVF